MNLVVSVRAALEAQMGSAGCGAIRTSLEAYARARTDAPVVLFLDDAADMSALGLSPIPSGAAASVLMGIRQVRSMLRSIDAVLLVGGDEVVPYWQFANPVTDRRVDPDAIVLTDNPYGAGVDTMEAYYAPDLPVGRLVNPGATAGDLAAVIDALTDSQASSRRRQGAAAIFNADWMAMTDAVAARLPEPIDKHPTPGYQLTIDRRADLNRRYLYFNLHGFAGQAAWKGFEPVRGQFFTAATPDSFDATYVGGSIVFVENCYGGQTGGRTAKNSCVLRLLQQGAAGIVAATGLAFGSHVEPDLLLQNADFLASKFFEYSASGTNVGLSLTRARQDYVSDSRVSLSNPFKQKTLLQFTLLGDPSVN